jgi:threonine dehydrogenase-like Zn-dependent dehydrogenase
MASTIFAWRRWPGHDPTAVDVVADIKRLTEGRGADVAIEALRRQDTFESALRSLRPGGTLSSLGVYSGKLVAPYEAVHAGLGDQRIVTTLCPLPITSLRSKNFRRRSISSVVKQTAQ